MLSARRLGALLRHHAPHAWWRTRDYAYVVRAQVQGLLHRDGAEAFLEPALPGGARQPTVVVLPGVYESWHFMRPVAALLHARGHVVHVLPSLGYNRAAIPDTARVVGAHLVEHDLHDVVLVAHSKGGLIGKMTMLHEDPDARVRSMVAINTPFAGSVYARWVPIAAVRAFAPTDTVLLALAAERDVNTRITSVYSRYDPHIPAGSVLAGARNIELATPGHFRVLADPALPEVLVTALGAPPGVP